MDTDTDTLNPSPGDFLSETLWTDTRVWEVVKVTPSTISIRHTLRGDLVLSQNRDGNPYPVQYHAAVSNPDAPSQVVRRRKDGTYRTGRGMNPLRPATVIDGQPVSYTDYRY